MRITIEVHPSMLRSMSKELASYFRAEVLRQAERERARIERARERLRDRELELDEWTEAK